MVSYSIVFASTATLVFAAPQMNQQPAWQLPEESAGVFTVPVSRVERTSTGSPGLDAVKQASARWGGGRVQQLTGKSSGEIPAAPPAQEPDYEYIAPIKIGKYTYNVVLDTGVTDTWIAKSAFKGLNTTCLPKKGYSWGTAVASGDIVCDDKVSVGDAVAKKHSVCVGDPIGEADPYTDGVLGLAPGSTLSTIKPSPQKGWLASVLPSLKKPIFILDLQHEAEGSVTFGDIPKTIDSEKLQWASLDTKKGKWSVSASGGYAIGGKHFKTEGQHSAIIDTGTTLIFMGKDVVDSYYKRIPGTQFNKTAYGGWTLPCKGNIPTFGVSFGEHIVTIPSRHMNYFPIDFGNTTCYGGLQAHESEAEPYVYGDTFVKSFYTVFDLKENKLGIAPKADKNNDL